MSIVSVLYIVGMLVVAVWTGHLSVKAIHEFFGLDEDATAYSELPDHYLSPEMTFAMIPPICTLILLNFIGCRLGLDLFMCAAK